MRELKISVTDLVSYVSRTGSLSSGSYNGVTGAKGTRLHQKIFSDLEQQYGNNIETEYYLNSNFDYTDFRLSVSGRCDVLLNDNQIIEIKSFGSAKDSYEKLYRPEHEAQLKIYAFMYMEKMGLDSLFITLRYVSINTLQAFEKTYEISYNEALENFDKHCNIYINFAISLLDYNNTMLESVRLMTFPYLEIRSGQAEFMKKALFSLSNKEALFVEAPTGTGKTISTLYPAVKGLLKRKYEKIFYLTAKTATRAVALKALNDMRQNGLVIRSILLSSKENICPFPGDCDAKFCPLAKDYYTRLQPALSEVLLYENITPEVITEIALKHKICPHEFSLDTLNFCSVVIGDYNHAFDPRVSLVRCFSEENNHDNVLLVDEAHNLVDRAREMYSAEFSTELLNEAINEFKGNYPKIESYLSQISAYFALIDRCFAIKQSAFSLTESIDQKNCFITDNWEGTRNIPRNLYTIIWKTNRLIAPLLETLDKGPLRQTAMKFFFESRFFLTVIEQHFNDSYITSYEKSEGIITVKLNCLDSSAKLNNLIRDKMSVIFFSATLSPFEYYRMVLLGKQADYTRTLSLPSPFPKENLELIINTDISTTYKNRNFTSKELSEIICEELDIRTGNYMVFFPSFEYMNNVCVKINSLFAKREQEDGIKRELIIQRPGMNRIEKEEFLNHFETPSNDILLGAAVLGGHFGEGIDLVGEKLSGVIIVGLGIPKVTPIRQVLSNYYAEQFGDGYGFAYRYPGWEKVLQAIGRVIRTETDTGFALLIDERLDKPEYIRLFPDHWNI